MRYVSAGAYCGPVSSDALSAGTGLLHEHVVSIGRDKVTEGSPHLFIQPAGRGSSESVKRETDLLIEPTAGL